MLIARRAHDQTAYTKSRKNSDPPNKARDFAKLVMEGQSTQLYVF